MNIRRFLPLWVAAAVLVPASLSGQEFSVKDPLLEAIWAEGMENSHIHDLAQTLSDSIGPRLPGSPAFDAAADWILKTYADWGVSGRTEEYGTWRAWERGITHADLLEPRVRSLDGMMQAVAARDSGDDDGYCNGCFTGKYPIHVGDAQAKLAFEGVLA